MRLLFTLGAIGFAVAPAVAPYPAIAADQAILRDGSHDFDFNFGTWHTHIRRIPNPLAGGDKVVELDGTVTVRKVWGGRAALEEIEADGPNGHWEGMTIFLYNPASGQWSQSFADSGEGVLQPPTIGQFRDGRGELFATDKVDNRSVLVRGVWDDIRPDSHSYAEYCSDDGGKSWKLAFIATLTRVKP